MHRLFVALRPPAAIRRQLLDLMGGVRGARWQDDEQLHITLRFIGEVEGPVAEDIAAALAQVGGPPIGCTLDGIGTFDRKGRIDTLWAGVTSHDALAVLHKKVDQAIHRVGLPREGRAYLPHITLARFGRHADDIDLHGFAERHGGLSSPRFTMAHFTLFESRTSHEGARYEAVARYPLND